MAGDNRLGPFIAARREAAGLTQIELGARLHISRQRVTQLEGGRKPWPAPDILNGLAKALETPIEEFLRAGGLAIPALDHEGLAWVVERMDDDGREQLAAIAHAILPHHRRRPETAQQ